MDASNPFGFDLNNFSGVLNPYPIYDAVGAAAGIWSGILPLMVFLVFVIRYFSESSRNLTGNARLAEAGGELLNETVIAFAYSFGGFLILKFLIALSGYFYSFGSFSVIAKDFGLLIADMKARQSDYDVDFITNFLDILTATTMPFTYLFFLITSSLFVLFHSLSRFIYALYFAIIYLWGFVAIPTGALKSMSLKQGWVRSFMILGIWPILEATLYFFMKFVIEDVSRKTLGAYTGADLAQFSAMHGLMGSVCLVLIIITLAAPYMAIRIGSNQEALSGLLTPATATAAYVYQLTMSKTRQMGGSMLPTGGGDRGRDKIIESLDKFNKGAVPAAGKAVSSSVRGLGNAVSNAMKGST